MATVPLSLELGANEDARDVVVADGTGTDAVAAGKLKIYLGTTVDLSKCQSIVGSGRAVFRTFMQQAGRKVMDVDAYAYANAIQGTAKNVVIDLSAPAGQGNFTLVISSTFADKGQTQYFSETFDQLINKLIETLKEN